MSLEHKRFTKRGLEVATLGDQPARLRHEYEPVLNRDPEPTDQSDER